MWPASRPSGCGRGVSARPRRVLCRRGTQSSVVCSGSSTPAARAAPAPPAPAAPLAVQAFSAARHPACACVRLCRLHGCSALCLRLCLRAAGLPIRSLRCRLRDKGSFLKLRPLALTPPRAPAQTGPAEADGVRGGFPRNRPGWAFSKTPLAAEKLRLPPKALALRKLCDAILTSFFCFPASF